MWGNEHVVLKQLLSSLQALKRGKNLKIKNTNKKDCTHCYLISINLTFGGFQIFLNSKIIISYTNKVKK